MRQRRLSPIPHILHSAPPALLTWRVVTSIPLVLNIAAALRKKKELIIGRVTIGEYVAQLYVLR